MIHALTVTKPTWGQQQTLTAMLSVARMVRLRQISRVNLLESLLVRRPYPFDGRVVHFFEEHMKGGLADYCSLKKTKHL